MKPTKSAIKKAAKLARTERRQQEKAAKARNPLAPSPSPSPAPPEPVYEPVKVTEKIYEITPVAAADDVSEDVHEDVPLVTTEQPPIVTIQPAPPQAQHVHRYDDVMSTPEPSYPTSMETSGRNSPEPLVDLTAQEDTLNAELQLALENKLAQQAEAERTKKKQNFLTRTLWGLIMIGGFIGTCTLVHAHLLESDVLLAALLLMGHAYMIMLVMLCQTLVYREVTALFSLRNATPESSEVEPVKNKKDPWSKTLNWYFFAVTNYFLYGESIIYYFKVRSSYSLIHSVLIYRSF